MVTGPAITIPADSWRLTYTGFSGATFTRRTMSTATFVFMIATYWVGGSAPTEGGRYLANGQVYNNKEFVAAHRTLPFGTILNVCLRRQCVAVVVKDRGPFLPKMDIERRIDLSYGAAKALGMLHDGRKRNPGPIWWPNRSSGTDRPAPWRTFANPRAIALSTRDRATRKMMDSLERTRAGAI